MNMTVEETEKFLKTFSREVEDVEGVDVVIAPPFTSLPKLNELLDGSQRIALGAQNFYPERSGAFTGEISALMLRDLFVRYVIVGHSERRQLLGETDDLVNRKILAAHATELLPILCVGETLQEREAGREKEVLRRQLHAALKDVAPSDLLQTTIAYEPIWAIGTGVNATPEQAQEAHAYARDVIGGLYDTELASKVRIQYGGSVKPDNARALLTQPDIDGALVGGASLEPRSFARIVRAGQRE